MDTQYFCNSRATGQHNRFRNIKHIDTYWKHTMDWDAIASREDLTLEALLTWFTGKTEGKAT